MGGGEVGWNAGALSLTEHSLWAGCFLALIQVPRDEIRPLPFFTGVVEGSLLAFPHPALWPGESNWTSLVFNFLNKMEMKYFSGVFTAMSRPSGHLFWGARLSPSEAWEPPPTRRTYFWLGGRGCKEVSPGHTPTLSPASCSRNYLICRGLHRTWRRWL